MAQVLPAWSKLLVDHDVVKRRRRRDIYAAVGTSRYSGEDVAMLWPLGPYAAYLLVLAPLDSQDDEKILG